MMESECRINNIRFSGDILFIFKNDMDYKAGRKSLLPVLLDGNGSSQ